MRIIQKQISLEPMTSRLPSVWPAYLDNKLYFFDDAHLKERDWAYTSNWGMVPVNIVVNHAPSELGEDGRPQSAETYSIVDGCHCYGSLYETNSGCSNCGSSSYDELCDFVLSFENLSKWYYFFTEYYNLLKKYSHCNRVYTSAEDYYNYESLTKYADQMIYGNDKQTYLDLDEEFANKGGRVEVQIYDKDVKKHSTMTPNEAHDEFNGDRMAMTDVYDVGFFKWICDNVVPSFTIPMEYRDYWKKDVLFYPDVIKWLKWFNDRESLYYEIEANFHLENDITELWDCNAEGVTSCTDCEEYFGRGGDRIYKKMKSWYNEIQNNILREINEPCSMPTIILPTELQLSIDDMGEFSIFSTDYELGKDYRVAHYGDSANTHSGTVVTMDGNSMYLSGDSLGFSFNPDYMEKFESGWTSYTDRYIMHEYDCNAEGCENKKTYNNKNEFYVSAVTYYTYDENNVKHTGAGSIDDAKNEIKKKLTKNYPLTTCENGWILIDGVLYEIKETEFGKYDQNNTYLKDNTYLVFREDVTDTPYTFVNGKKIFADFYPAKDNGVFYFPFFLSENANFVEKCSGKIFNIENYMQFKRHERLNHIYYIEYHGKVYNLGTDETQDSYNIDGIEYYKVSGYTVDEYGYTLYCINDEVKFYDDTSVVVLDNYTLEGYDTPSCIFEDNNNIIKIEPILDDEHSIFTIYSVDEITGQTVSKLSDIRLYNVLTDDVGNTIEGIYDVRAVGTSGATAHQPPQGTELELIYQVGNTANIQRFSQTKDDMDDIIDDYDKRNYFVGDIITKMTFYYKDYDGNVVNNTVRYAELGSDDVRYVYNSDKQTILYPTLTESGDNTSLFAIQSSTAKKDELEESGKTKYMYDDIYCDITYYVGATLSRKEGKQYNLASKSETRGDKFDNYGVEYTETVRFVKTNWEYYLKKPKDENSILPSKRKKPCNHSVSYPIYVYVLTQDLTRVDESQYKTEYSVPMADFKFEINIFSGNGDTFGEKYPEEMATHNNLQVFPTYREEYRFGVSSIENVDSDIYIDRGINAAFEKHLKLGEVTSLEALEQYGNGYFKIMES